MSETNPADADARTDWLQERGDIPDDDKPHIDYLFDHEKPEKRQ